MRQLARCRLKILGSPFLLVDGRPLNLGSNKALAILSYLALHRTPLWRSELEGVLWPEANHLRARRSLRDELSRLGRQLPAGMLIAQGQQLFLSHDLNVDVWHFEQALRKGLWERAATLYTGELLEGFHVRSAALFESWLSLERDRLRTAYLNALGELRSKAAEAGDFGAALAFGQQIVSTDPLSEAGYLQVMRLAHQAGETAVALESYHQLQMLLKQEFGITPSQEATDMAREIAGAVRTRLTPSATRPLGPHLSHNLPAPLTPFVGRKQELARLETWLDHPDCRLIALTGLGGVGKTRLALEVATRKLAQFSDGVYYLDCTRLQSPEDLVGGLASLAGVAHVATQLTNAWRDKTLLLILDRLESTPAIRTALDQLLPQLPQVKTIVTARRELKLSGQYLMVLRGLRLPEDTEGAEVLEQDAVALFVQSARRVRLFELAPANRPWVVKICQSLSGFPLGIELAALRLRSHSCREIAEELERRSEGESVSEDSDDFAPLWERLEQTWQRLEVRDQQVFRALAVLEQPFDFVTAANMAGASKQQLAKLLDISLLQRIEEGYALPVLLKGFAAEKWTAVPERERQAAV